MTLPSINAAPYVSIELASTMTGYTPKAIREKIASGVWIEGRQYRRAPDGRVLVSMRGYKQWVERAQA